MMPSTAEKKRLSSSRRRFFATAAFTAEESATESPGCTALPTAKCYAAAGNAAAEGALKVRL